MINHPFLMVYTTHRNGDEWGIVCYCHANIITIMDWFATPMLGNLQRFWEIFEVWSCLSYLAYEPPLFHTAPTFSDCSKRLHHEMPWIWSTRTLLLVVQQDSLLKGLYVQLWIWTICWVFAGMDSRPYLNLEGTSTSLPWLASAGAWTSFRTLPEIAVPLRFQI